jgi:hypothetical protein
MSGTGKSSVIQDLTAQGYKAIDTDWDPEWEQLNGTTYEGIAETDWVWREDRIMSLLAVEDAEKLFLSACVPNQGKFYGRFDHIVLLSASDPMTRERLASRTNNSYGKSGDEITDVLGFKATVEPMLRRVASLEIDTTIIPVSEVTAKVLALAEAETGDHVR